MKAFKRQEEEATGAPAWIVSFTDMITLLLAFFVMLLALAQEQDPDLFLLGQGSFRRSIAGLGIPNILFGKEHKIEGQSRKRRYSIEEAMRITRQRVIDPKDDLIRQVFSELKQSMETTTGEGESRPRNIITIATVFSPSSASLTPQISRELGLLAANFAQNLNRDQTRIYILTSAANESTRRRQWILSARRAKAVSEFLSQSLSSRTGGQPWRLIPLGTGAGRAYDSRPTGSRTQEFIKIVIVGAK